MKRISIITGASAGLGREYALQLSKYRNIDEIWLIARRKNKLEELKQECIRSGKISVRIIEIDLSEKTAIHKLEKLLEEERTDKAKQGFVVDSLVNNAGFGTYGTFEETDLNRQLDMIQVNISALTALSYLAIPYMQPGSILINIASLAGFIPLGNFAVYGATKAYVLNFSTALAAEVADKGIFVSTVCPGPIDTEFAQVASLGARTKVIDGKKTVDVVMHSLSTIKKNKHFAIMALNWKIKAFLSRFIPRYGYARYSFKHEKRPSN